MHQRIAWHYSTPGIPDDWFIQGGVPMTKAEARTITLSRARLKRDSIIYDIGAGTGSIAVEAALLAPQGQVFAVERNPEAIGLIRQNAIRFGAGNLEIIEGEAPGALSDLSPADRIIIGGSGGHLRDILCVAREKLLDGGRLVINSISLETFCTSLEALPWEGLWIADICCVTVARVAGIEEVRMWQGLNPVYIITAVKGKEEAQR
ncbi:MAG: precorrin-6Y C5,15-methyltransferase (decarboxylating) subunit CbiT [Firmicutes bacterium]|nr:precorrin-6Y C5,15-methyltransferase (decarboxylating) subunit CbiT [Bacillota bacterium]